MARILIAEDEEALRALTARALTDSGHEVVTAIDGADALDILTRENVERIGAIDRGHDLMPGIGQRASGQRAQRLLILGNKNAGHGQAFFSTTPTNGSWRYACATSMP